MATAHVHATPEFQTSSILQNMDELLEEKASDILQKKLKT